jgi:superfamily II DNA or RNA helicase
MASFSEFLLTFNADPAKKGREFELFVKYFLQADPEWKTQVEDVWLWEEFPGRWGPDCGIDLVFRDKNGANWAVQAKCYAPEYEITKSDVDRFLSESNRKEIQHRLLIATTDRINANAKRVCEAQDKLVVRYGLSNFENATVDFPAHIDNLLNIRKGDSPTPRDHQLKAIDAVIEGFLKADKGQLIMACGTGKTYTCLWIKEKLKARSTVVLVPTLGLLSQTLREWTAATNNTFEVLCVCSDTTAGKVTDETIHTVSDLAFPVSSNHIEISNFLSKDVDKIIFATYQSSRLIAEAQIDQAIPEFDLVIADEAHRLAGKVDSDFSLALDSKRIRSKKRLFATATPRLYSTSVQKSAESRGIDIVSMEDGGAFGDVFFKLSFGEAIRRGLLSDYRVVVIGVDDEMVSAWIRNRELLITSTGYENDAESLSTQVGLLKGMKDYDLKRVISFHSKIKRAEQFSKELSAAAVWISSEGNQVGRVKSDFVSGEMPTFKRRQKLRDLRNLDNADRRVLSNARCLAEGIDVPMLDGVAFIDPKSSQIEIIQAVGRAIRLSPDKKIGTIVIPVFLGNAAELDPLIESGGFKAIWNVLNALKSHDEELANDLNQLRFELGKKSGGGFTAHPPKVYFDLPVKVSKEFADKLRLITVEQTSESWEFWFGLLQTYLEKTGSTRVPSNYITSSGHKLGNWVQTQRGRKDDLSPERINRLIALPEWIWDVHEARWEDAFFRLTKYVEKHGTCLMSGTYVGEDGFKLGQWVKSKRTSRQELTPERQTLLGSMPDWTWNVTDAQWEKGFFHLEQYVRQHGTAWIHAKHQESDGFYLGRWVSSNRAKRLDLVKEQIDRLEALPGWTWDALDERWESAFRCLEKYVHDNQTSRVPARFIDDSGFKLGGWVNQQRKGFDSLEIVKRQKLEALPNWSWRPFEELWDQGYEMTALFAKEHGHCNVPPKKLFTAAGNDVNVWISRQRLKFDALTEEQKSKLEKLPGWAWDPFESTWQEMFSSLQDFAKNEGNTLVPTNHLLSNGKKLGQWVSDQRKRYLKGKLTAKRQELLESVPDWTWDAVRYKWEQSFKKFQEYVRKMGTTKIDVDHRTNDGYWLGRWVLSQRKNKLNLLPDQVASLEEFHDWEWP